MQHDDRAAQKQLREETKASQLLDISIDAAVADMMASRSGRDFLWWLLQIGRVGTQPFLDDPYRTAFACGELNIGHQVFARILTVSPDGYITMTKERSENVNRVDPDPDTDDSAGPHDSGDTLVYS